MLGVVGGAGGKGVVGDNYVRGFEVSVILKCCWVVRRCN